MMREGLASKTVLIVIVNYRSAGLVVDCLRTLEPEIQAVPGTRVVVVENASGDDSADHLASAIDREGWGAWASMVASPRNGGFAAGNNVAIAPALAADSPPDLIWLLNPDTLVQPNAFVELVKFFDRQPTAGLAGSKLVSIDGSPQWSAFGFPSILGELETGLRIGTISRLLRRPVQASPGSDLECQVDWVAGASLMIRREVFEKIGLLDEGYFMYFEEVDFCLRAFRAGWPCWYVPSSRIVHLIGQSTGLTNENDFLKRRPRYWFDARRRFFLVNHGRLKTFVANSTFTMAFGLNRIRRRIWHTPDIDPKWMLWDFFRYNFLPVKR